MLLSHWVMPSQTDQRFNLQFYYQLLMVFLVGAVLGTFRTITPEFSVQSLGVAQSNTLLLSTFVIFFGLVKAVLNLFAGYWADQYGRKTIMLYGWLMACPIPIFIYFADNWYWMMVITICLGIQQGICWSMTQIIKVDLCTPERRGAAMGLNEFFGYVGVGVAGYLASYLAQVWSAKMSLLLLLAIIIGFATLLTQILLKETSTSSFVHTNSKSSSTPKKSQLFYWVSWQDKRLFALCQAALIEKFVDVLLWLFYPIFLVQRGFSLTQAALVTSAYAVTWGVFQLFTGILSDYIGRIYLIILGFWICALGLMLQIWIDTLSLSILCASFIGLGMAMLYPTLGAAVSDLCEIEWRSTAMGIYRFWRDLGYFIGAFLLGIMSLLSTQFHVFLILTSFILIMSSIILFVLTSKNKKISA